jgi:peptide/nickel transport system ATP-binding protein
MNQRATPKRRAYHMRWYVRRRVDFLDEWSLTRGAGIVLLTHDIGLARSRGRRVVVLYRGEIVEELPGGRVDEAVHPYTRGLLDSAVRLGDPPRSRKSIPGHAVRLQGVPEGCGYGDRCPWVEEACTRERPALVGTGSHQVRCRRATALETTRAGQAH